MRIPLLFREGRSELHPLLGIFNGPFQGGHATAQAKSGNHQPGIAEHLIGLFKALTLNSPNKIPNRNKKVFQGQGTGIRSADTVFILMLPR